MQHHTPAPTQAVKKLMAAQRFERLKVGDFFKSKAAGEKTFLKTGRLYYVDVDEAESSDSQTETVVVYDRGWQVERVEKPVAQTLKEGK